MNMVACPKCGAVEVICNCEVEEPVLTEPDPEERIIQFTAGTKRDRWGHEVPTTLDARSDRHIDAFMRNLGYIVLKVDKYEERLPDGDWRLLGFNVHVINKFTCLCCGVSIVDMKTWDKTRRCRACGESCIKEPGHGKIDGLLRDLGLKVT